MRTGEIERWDVFLAHAGADVDAAAELAGALTRQHGLSCFLDADTLRAGDGWPVELKRALAASRVIAVIVSSHSDQAFYLQEEVAIAIVLYRLEPESVRIVPVLRRDAEQIHLPYGTFSLHALREDERGWPPVADAIHGVVQTLRPRDAGTALANSLRRLDELWAGLEPALTDKDGRVPADFRVRLTADGPDLVGRDRSGREQQRVTRSELDARLSDEDLELLVVLERSMEVNKALWDARYPNRALDKRSRRAADEAADALADDLADVLDLVQRAGLWLDDHYQQVRWIVDQRRTTGR